MRTPIAGYFATKTPGAGRVLVRHFFGRFFDQEPLSPGGEPAANVIQTLGILAVPGAFFALLCALLGVRGWDLVSTRCLFAAFSMIAMGILVVLKWDALFLDLRDYQVLMPLPVSLWKLFAAKTAALGLFLGLFLADLNFFAALFWPAVEKSNGMFAAFATHLFLVSASGLFAALAAAALQGLLIAALPLRVFRPISLAVQTVLMAALVMLLFLSLMLSGAIGLLFLSHNPAVCFVPPYWFAGLYERLHPAVHNPELLNLGRFALPALGCAAALFALTHLPGYGRHARKLLESPQLSAAGPGWLQTRIHRVLNRLLLADPAQRAVFYFLGRTIGRSPRHRLFLAAYAGLGAALAVWNFGTERDGLLRLPLTFSFVLISGMRAAFQVPVELRANWTFQLNGTDDLPACLAAVRKWIAICGLGPLLLSLVPVETAFFPWREAIFHILYNAVLSLVLLELLFAGFRKIPFTCAYFPGRINLVWLSVMYVCGFTIYSREMAALESRLMDHPPAAAAFLVLAAAALLCLARWQDRQTAAETGLDYEGAADPAVRTLQLQ